MTPFLRLITKSNRAMHTNERDTHKRIHIQKDIHANKYTHGEIYILREHTNLKNIHMGWTYTLGEYTYERNINIKRHTYGHIYGRTLI